MMGSCWKELFWCTFWYLPSESSMIPKWIKCKERRGKQGKGPMQSQKNKAGDLMLSKPLAQNTNRASSLPCAYWLNNKPIRFCHNLSQFDLDFLFLLIKSMLSDTIWKRCLLASLNLIQFLTPTPGHMSSSDVQPINYLIRRPQKARGMVRLRDKAGLGNILAILLAKGKKSFFLPRQNVCSLKDPYYNILLYHTCLDFCVHW